MNKDPQSGELTLIEFGDAPRFTPTQRYHCPQCDGPALQDNWPPNFSGGTMTPTRIDAHGSIKHVCVRCRIAFRVNWTRVFEQGEERERFLTADVVPLIERDGHLLTPHDTQRFAYFDQHGVWPTEVSA